MKVPNRESQGRLSGLTRARASRQDEGGEGCHFPLEAEC